MERTFYVYILASDTFTLYIGITNNLERRMWENKTGNFADAFSTRYGLHRLVHIEDFADVRDAIAREKQLKGWRRAKKIALIERTNPYWHDLSREWGPRAAPAGAFKSTRSVDGDASTRGVSLRSTCGSA